MARRKRRMKKKKEFHHYLDFPLDIRKVVIDEMRASDRCRFTRCSKQSNIEAKSSENFFYDLRIILLSDHVLIVILLEEYEDGEFLGYELYFKEINGKKMRQYKCQNSRKSWEIELDGSKNVFEQGIEEFKKLLQTHQKAIRRLEIADIAVQNNLRDFDFEIKNLKNLKMLFINGNVNIQQYLSKLKRPLEILDITKNDEDFYDQIPEVTKILRLDNPNFTGEQFRRIKAKDVYIAIGELTEMDVFQFIQSWQNGTIGREIEAFTWNLNGSLFDERTLLRWLKLSPNDVKTGVEIKHFRNPRLSARLNLEERYLEFEVIKPIVNEQ